MIPSSLRAVFDEAVDDGLATGWQVYAEGRHGVISGAGGVDGLGREMRSDSLIRPYCAIKPLLAMTIATLVDDGELSFEDRLSDLMPVPGHWPAVTVEDLLRHRSGIGRPSAIEISAMPPDERSAAVLKAPLCVPPLGVRETYYSEAVTWIVLAAALEELTGEDVCELARARVLKPAGLADEFDLADEVDQQRLAVNVALRKGRRWPLLIERTPLLGWTHNPGYGGAATVKGLVGLAREQHLSTRGDGLVSQSVAQQMTAQSPRRRDRVLQLDLSYGLGWMVDMSQMDFGPSISDSAYGHVGLTGMTAIWVDPEAELWAGYHINGFTDGQTAVGWLRPRVSRAMMKAAS